MKKIISVISSLVLAAGMTSAFAVNAADEYKPTFYIKGEAGTGVEILKYGTVYVNKTVAGEGAKIPAAVYFKDDEKIAGQIFVKWTCENKDLQLTDITGPFAKTGNAPYKISGVSSDADLVNCLKNFTDLNIMAANYSETDATKTLQLTGDTSDAYPLACFSASFKNNAPGGSYDIEFYDKGAYFTSVIPRYLDDPTKTVEVYPAEYSEGLRINASDRLLGDVDGDGDIDAVDASKILSAYAAIATDQPSGFTPEQEAAADVDGNRSIDSVDASGVLAYYAFGATSDENKSLNQFIKGE